MSHKHAYSSNQLSHGLLRTTALGLILCVLPISAHATTWTGATDTDWFNAGNWDAGVPDSAKSAYVDAGTLLVDASAADTNILRLGVTNGAVSNITISNGGTIESHSTTSSSVIGWNAGSISTGTVTGSGSSWTSGANFLVGYSGAGTLTVEDGGAVSNTIGYIGFKAGSTGTATVTGAGSTWTNTAQLYVGNLGTGTLTVADGGQVSNTSVIIGNSTDSVGVINVTGPNSTWTSSDQLIIGSYGKATLSISNGGLVQTLKRAVIADGAGSNCNVTVTGTNSTWNISDYLSIGLGWDGASSGDLLISNSGKVTNTYALVGNRVGSSGTATVTGAGSTWTNSSYLNIGYSGTGALTIADSGIVSTTAITISSQASSVGTLNIGAASGQAAVAAGTLSTPTVTFGAGTGSLIFNHTNTDYDFDAAISGAGTIRALSGTTNLTADNSGFTGNTYVGGTATGATTATLNITGGADLGGNEARIGDGVGTIGIATVAGAGSTWVNTSQLRVGNSGTGTLTIADGGQVNNTTGFIGYSAGSTGAATITGIGSAWASTDNFYVGLGGIGTLTVSDGGAVTNSTSFLGHNAGSTGTATVSGVGSTWINTNSINVGNSGTATLNIEDGGQVMSTFSRIGQFAGSNGTTTVTGAGSTWTNSSNIYVGAGGTGTFNIKDGGAVSNTYSIVGAGAGSAGYATVTGSGSLWTSSEYSAIGHNGTGTLTIENGATVSDTDAYIGNNVGSTGSASVTGTGSTWTNSNNLHVGTSGTGTLTISNSATVSATSATIATNAGSTGTLNIGAASGSPAVAAGTLSTPTVAFGAGTGTLLFNHTSTIATPYLFTPDVTGAGAIRAESGVTSMTGDLSGFTGTTTVDDAAQLTVAGAYGGDIAVEDNSKAIITAAVGGDVSADRGSTLTLEASVGGDATVGTASTLVANNIVTGTVTVNSGGTLKGSGTVGGVDVASGGIVAPGNSIGTINIAGNVAFVSGSFLDVEVDADGNSDLTHATGTANISGGTVRLMPELVSDTFALNAPYTILTADGGIGGPFDAIIFSSPSLFLTAALSYDATNVYATVMRNATAFSGYAVTFNETQIATALDNTTSGAALAAVGTQGTALNARAAMDHLSGEIHADVKGQILEAGSAFSHLIFDQSSSSLKDTSKGNYWGLYYGHGQNAHTASTHALEISGNGFAMGRMEAVNDNTEVGFALSYGSSKYTLDLATDNDAKANAKHYQTALYAKQKHGNWNLKASAQYGYHQVETNRHVSFTGYDDRHRADYGAHSFTGYGEASYTALETTKLRVAPYAGLTYGYGLISSFKETGGAGLTAQNDGYLAGWSVAGARLEQQLYFDTTPATLTFDLGWHHRIGAANPTGSYSFDGSPTFRSQGTGITRDELTFKAGFNVSLTDNVDLNLNYKTTHSPTTSSHNGKIGINVKF